MSIMLALWECFSTLLKENALHVFAPNKAHQMSTQFWANYYTLANTAMGWKEFVFHFSIWQDFLAKLYILQAATVCCQCCRNVKLNMNLKVLSAKIQLKLNKLEKTDIKWGLFHAILRVFAFRLILTEY